MKSSAPRYSSSPRMVLRSGSSMGHRRCSRRVSMGILSDAEADSEKVGEPCCSVQWQTQACSQTKTEGATFLSNRQRRDWRNRLVNGSYLGGWNQNDLTALVLVRDDVRHRPELSLLVIAALVSGVEQFQHDAEPAGRLYG